MKRLILISASFILGSSAFGQSRCVTAPVSVTNSQTTITTSGAKAITEKQTYIYYASKHGKKHQREYRLANVNEKYPSQPLMVNSGKDVAPIPETYKVTVTTPESKVSICPDSAVNVAANINIEKVSSYTGNYPNADSKTYIKVSKRDYKMAERKLRKIERKERKIVHKSGTSVDVKSAKA